MLLDDLLLPRQPVSTTHAGEIIANRSGLAQAFRIYAHVRDQAMQEAIQALSRPDGWKPKENTVRKLLMPQGRKFDSARVVSIVRKAKQIKAETAARRYQPG